MYALAAVPFNSLAVSCDCLAHVYGNAASADQPDRQQVYPSGTGGGLGVSRDPGLRRMQEGARPQAACDHGCLGPLLVVAVTAANVGDREAAVPPLERLRARHRKISSWSGSTAATPECSPPGRGTGSASPSRSSSAVMDRGRCCRGGGSSSARSAD